MRQPAGVSTWASVATPASSASAAGARSRRTSLIAHLVRVGAGAGGQCPAYPARAEAAKRNRGELAVDVRALVRVVGRGRGVVAGQERELAVAQADLVAGPQRRRAADPLA